MSKLTINAAGHVFQGDRRVRAVVGTVNGNRILSTDLDTWCAGDETNPGINVDVTRAWGNDDLGQIVTALLAQTDLPAGWSLGMRKDGVALLRKDK